eukprot:4501734-Lingulodinium_polyedra.AAC.1
MSVPLFAGNPHVAVVAELTGGGDTVRLSGHAMGGSSGSRRVPALPSQSWDTMRTAGQHNPAKQ